jgi:hypothetical protein
MTIMQILSGDPSYSNSKLQPRELAEAIINGLRPEPRPSSIEGDQYDGLWDVMQQGWAGHHEIRRVLAMQLRYIAMQLQPSRCIAVLR